MTTREAIARIESPEAGARLNLASDLSMFLRAASEEQAVVELRTHLDRREVLAVVLTHVLELSRRAIDTRYRHPWDAALAIYILLLNQKDQAVAAVAAEAVAQTPQCWWASQFAMSILRPGLTSNSTRTQDLEIRIRPVHWPSVAQREPVPELLVLGGFVRERSRFTQLELVSSLAVTKQAA